MFTKYAQKGIFLNPKCVPTGYVKKKKRRLFWKFCAHVVWILNGFVETKIGTNDEPLPNMFSRLLSRGNARISTGALPNRPLHFYGHLLSSIWWVVVYMINLFFLFLHFCVPNPLLLWGKNYVRKSIITTTLASHIGLRRALAPFQLLFYMIIFEVFENISGYIYHFSPPQKVDKTWKKEIEGDPFIFKKRKEIGVTTYIDDCPLLLFIFYDTLMANGFYTFFN